MSENALVTFQGLPEHLKGYVSDSAKSDLGRLKPSDIGVSFLKCCQTQSREARPNPSTGEPGIQFGAMFDSRSRKIIPVGTLIIPLLRTVRYIKWIGRPGEGRMEFTTDNENDPRIKACNGLQFTTDPRTQKQLPPLVTEYTNFYVACREIAEPVLLSFARTSVPIGRRWTQDLIKATKGRLPLRCLTFKLGQPSVKRDASNEWYQFNIEPAGFTDAAAMKKVDELHEAALAMHAASTGAEFTQIDEDEDDPAETFTKQQTAEPMNVVGTPANAQPTQQATQQQPAVQQQQAPVNNPAPLQTAPNRSNSAW